MTRITPDASGFSLIELVTVLVVFGIVLSFGIPSFWRYSQSQQLRGTSENLVQTIQLQRSRAMATGQNGPRWRGLHSSVPPLTLVTSIEGLLRESNPLAVTRQTRTRRT